MAKQAITTIKNWFKTSLKPTQQQFWDWLDSFRHKDVAIEINEIPGLREELDALDAGGGGDTNYKGYFLSEADLIIAFPVGEPGWNAYVDVTGEPVMHYAWDVSEAIWRSTGSVQTITEVPYNNNYLRTLGGWVEGVLKSTYDAFVTATNSAISTINTKLNKYPSTATNGKFLKGNGTDYVEGDVGWLDVQNKPTTFAPSAHTHPISDITNLQSTLDAKELIIVPYISKANLIAIDPTTERRILVSISANATLSFSRALINGESGVINITNTVATSSTITLPANSIVEGAGGAILVTTGILNSRDRVTWEYDGIKIWWTYGENYN